MSPPAHSDAEVGADRLTGVVRHRDLVERHNPLPHQLTDTAYQLRDRRCQRGLTLARTTQIIPRGHRKRIHQVSRIHRVLLDQSAGRCASAAARAASGRAERMRSIAASSCATERNHASKGEGAR